MPNPARRACLLIAPMLLAGCAGMGMNERPSPRFTPAGQTLQVVAANGATSQMSFRPDGVVAARFGERSINGRWELESDNICFRWGNAPRECWRNPAPFQRGRTQSITSDRGNVVRVTRL